MTAMRPLRTVSPLHDKRDGWHPAGPMRQRFPESPCGGYTARLALPSALSKFRNSERQWAQVSPRAEHRVADFGSLPSCSEIPSLAGI